MTIKEAIDKVMEERGLTLPLIADILGVTYTGLYLHYTGKAKGKLRMTTVIKFYKSFEIALDPYDAGVIEAIIKAKAK